jgi:hypothetical protein
MAARQENEMREKLAEIVAKAVRDPAAYPDLTLVYQRGHEMSGITRFEMRAGGAYTLSTNNPRRQTSAHFEGELEAGQRSNMLNTMADTHLTDVPSSTRNIADDELPVAVELGYDNLRHQIVIWAEDALENPGFHRFETALWALLRQLSNGEVGSGPGG